jgi:hypothetical protein
MIYVCVMLLEMQNSQSYVWWDDVAIGGFVCKISLSQDYEHGVSHSFGKKRTLRKAFNRYRPNTVKLATRNEKIAIER